MLKIQTFLSNKRIIQVIAVVLDQRCLLNLFVKLFQKEVFFGGDEELDDLSEDEMADKLKEIFVK